MSKKVVLRVEGEGEEWVATLTLGKRGVSLRRPRTTPLLKVVEEAIKKCEQVLREVVE